MGAPLELRAEAAAQQAAYRTGAGRLIDQRIRRAAQSCGAPADEWRQFSAKRSDPVRRNQRGGAVEQRSATGNTLLARVQNERSKRPEERASCWGEGPDTARAAPGAEKDREVKLLQKRVRTVEQQRNGATAIS